MDNSPISMLDLKAQYLALKPELDAAVLRVVESALFINGPDVEAMEAELAQYCRAKYCIGLSSGSDARAFHRFSNRRWRAPWWHSRAGSLFRIRPLKKRCFFRRRSSH